MAEHCQHVRKYLHRLIYSGVLQSAQFYLFMWLFWRTPSTLKIAKSSPPQVSVQTELTLLFSQKHFIFTILYFLYFREEGRNIIFLDETWIDTSYTNKKVWQSDDVPGIYMPYNKGQRLIVNYAGGEKGFVPGAQEIFNPGLASGDYHGHMDGSNFEKWYNKKLLPNLPSNSIIVMDNASYHSVQTDRAPTTATRKADIQIIIEPCYGLLSLFILNTGKNVL